MLINLYDSNFSFTKDLLGYITCSDRRKPSYFKWWFQDDNYEGVTVFTDFFIESPKVDQSKSKYKIAWLVEPPDIHPFAYDAIIKNEHKFDKIFTYVDEYLNRGQKYTKVIIGSSRVKDHEAAVYPKSKLVSFIASDKNMTHGHRLRHEIAKRYNPDIYGTGYNKFESRLVPFSEYMFSIVVMNSRINNFFTEALVDCFRTGTIPILWGCPNISEYFNENGIISFSDLNELGVVLDKISHELYQDKIKAVYENFLISQNYISTEDGIFRYLCQNQ